MTLLTRGIFRETVFMRDAYRCVVCAAAGQDAHHIIERRLFPDGGYYADNGATLCGPCHLRAESTELSAQTIRDFAGITGVVLPPHLYGDETYDKWGNVILPNGTRLQGELFDDVSVQKALAPVLHLFTSWVKYPRTWHLPWSDQVTDDDRVLSPEQTLAWDGSNVIITEKMDGENTTMYRGYMHARSINYSGHMSRDYVKALHARISYDIPEDFRVCGENLYAEHSIGYDSLPGYFMVFSIWQGLRCLSWDDTVEWAALLGLPVVPVLYRGAWTRLTPLPTLNYNTSEGYVIRPSGEFTLSQFKTRVGKFVRKNHVQTHGHWMRSTFTPNGLQK